MMNYMVFIAQPCFPLTSSLRSTPAAAWPQQQQVAATLPEAVFFPMHKSLEEEMHRLFISDNRVKSNFLNIDSKEDVMEEFRKIGKDYEYLSDEESVPKPPSRKRKPKKPLPTECVFCKNNGEGAPFYRNHVLKDSDGIVLCPILRKYECPICGAKGDNSHTLKYCPLNGKTSVGIINDSKYLRNAVGKRRK